VKQTMLYTEIKQSDSFTKD